MVCVCVCVCISDFIFVSSFSAFPEDGAYLEDELKRREYVKNETGMIYAGTDASMFTWPWNFGQVNKPPPPPPPFSCACSLTVSTHLLSSASFPFFSHYCPISPPSQFEDVALDAVLYMMDMFSLDSDDRRSPIRVSRCMAEMVSWICVICYCRPLCCEAS